MTGQCHSARLGLLVAACLLAGACQTPGAIPLRDPVATRVSVAPMLPEAADYAAAELAAAALANDIAGAARAYAVIEAEDEARVATGGAPSGLSAYALDAWNSTRYPGRSYRDATEALLDRNDVPHPLRTRLERMLHDDPLVLAGERINDARQTQAAKLFNSLAEPAGRAITTTAMLPYHIALSMTAYLLEIAQQEPMSVQHRQALAHWKVFLRRYPDAKESPEVEAKVAEAELDWNDNRHRSAHRKAEDALEAGFPRRALFHAERGLHHSPNDLGCTWIKSEANKRISARDERLLARLMPAGAAQASMPPGTRELALATLAPNGDPHAMLATLPDSHPLIPEARFAAATVDGEQGRDDLMNATLRELAAKRGSGMARHALTELADPIRNPYDAFDTLRTRDEWSRALWIIAGPALHLPRDTRLATIGKWLLGLPMRLQAVVGFPMRLAAAPWNAPSPAIGETAIQARRYLALHPDGRHANEVSLWLEDYERDRKNWLGALKVVSNRPEPDPAVVEELRERAAGQAFEVAQKEQRRDLRNAMLHNVTRQFPDTESGRQAGRLARAEVEELRPHSIRISRGFLDENPGIAGPNGLGLEPTLLDGNNSNGELHPEGVRLIGGREIEVSYVDADGDDEAPAERAVAQVSPDRLARIVSRLEERSFHNALTDSDDPIAPDAQRDLLFERTRLGLADNVDTRASAQAEYSYLGLRERYGMVRTRESILPFDLVLQGSLETLSLGAFPRMRAPKKTADAILYE
jgi:hypothetical protein